MKKNSKKEKRKEKEKKKNLLLLNENVINRLLNENIHLHEYSKEKIYFFCGRIIFFYRWYLLSVYGGQEKREASAENLQKKLLWTFHPQKFKFNAHTEINK